MQQKVVIGHLSWVADRDHKEDTFWKPSGAVVIKAITQIQWTKAGNISTK